MNHLNKTWNTMVTNYWNHIIITFSIHKGSHVTSHRHPPMGWNSWNTFGHDIYSLGQTSRDNPIKNIPVSFHWDIHA